MLLPEHELASAGARTIDVSLYLGNCDGGVCEDASPIAMDSVQILVSVSVKTEGGNDYFGSMFEHIHAAGACGGSEFGLGALLFSTALSVRAKTVVEIGRWKVRPLRVLSLRFCFYFLHPRGSGLPGVCATVSGRGRGRSTMIIGNAKRWIILNLKPYRTSDCIDRPNGTKEAQDRLTAAGLIKYFLYRTFVSTR